MKKFNSTPSPEKSIEHLQPDVWLQANISLVKKCLSEFSHERLIEPQKLVSKSNGWSKYRVYSDDELIFYEFEAKELQLHYLMINEKSILKMSYGDKHDLDAILFIKEFRNSIGLADKNIPMYLEEITSTLCSSAFKILKGNPTAKELVHADFQTIEASMTEGHPGFIANNGRIGFDSTDFFSYAPETGNSFKLLWIAGHKSKAVYAAIEALPYQKILEQELGKELIMEFNNIIHQKGLSPSDYLFFPIHPWQWFNKLTVIFAPEIARKDLLCLGYGTDAYLAQQSIRTLFNQTNPKKFYTKSALSILNMGFMRGLPLYYLETAPKMAVWLEALLYKDEFIMKTGFKMLSEIGSVSYVISYYQEFGPHNDYNKMLASLWRESPYSKIKEGQKPVTMAALLHIDHHGNALLPEYIKDSGLSVENWISSYLKVYLSPLIHCFYKYDLVFMPHGENIILVLENNKPVSVLLKDITEEATILSSDVVLPKDLERMYASVPEDVKLLSIFTDIFDGFFRYLTPILEVYANFPETKFWELVAKNIKEYQDQFPQFEDKFKQYDLFADTFKLSCLNRLQIKDHTQMIALANPAENLQFSGELKNPIAIYKTENKKELLT